MVVTDAGPIVWMRWLIYLIVGVPFLGWLFFTRSNMLRVLAVVIVLVFIQNSFVSRRYIGAVGVGASNIVAYVALIALYLSRKQFPPLGAALASWMALLFFGLVGLVIGWLGSGTPTWNVIQYQQLYVEQFVFFLLGTIAFTKDEELRRFLIAWVFVGLAVAIVHFVTLATGFRFRDFAQAAEDTAQWHYGGVFSNANTMGAFYCLCLPIAVLLASGARLPVWTRAFVIAALVAMTGSLILAVHRGGMITNTVVVMGALASRSRRPSRALGAVLGIGLVIAAAYFMIIELLPDFVEASKYMAQFKGLETPRFSFWPRIMLMIVEHPVGIGLAPEDMLRWGPIYGFDVSSAHNLYLTIAAQAGILGLGVFGVLIATILGRAFSALRTTDDPQRKLLMTCLITPVFGFLVVGLSESVWENGYKINNLFGLMSGVCFGTSTRLLLEAWRSREQESPLAHDPASGLERASAPGF